MWQASNFKKPEMDHFNVKDEIAKYSVILIDRACTHIDWA